MAANNKKKNSGPGFPLSLLDPVLELTSSAQGGLTPGSTPLKAAQQVTQQEQKYAPGPVKTGLSGANTALTGAQDVTSSLGSALAFLTSGQNWLRLGEVLAGALLLLFGLITLSGGSAGGAAKKAAMVAL